MIIMDSFKNIILDTRLSTSLTLFHCGYERCKPSHSFGPAIRPHYLFHFVLNGCGKYYANNRVYPVSKGQGFLIIPGETTYYQADDNNPWEYCWIGFDGLDVKKILTSCGLDNNRLIFNDKSEGKLEETLMGLFDMYEDGHNNEYTILGQLYLCFSHMYNNPTNNPNLLWESYLEKALSYIHNNYVYDIQVSDIANHVGIDRTYLYKIFKAHKYMSPLEYLNNYRLNIAKSLLVETELNITEILYSSGFTNTSAFYKHFKKNIKMTPLEYREKNRKQ